ncbi:MAG: hypothetical protein HGA62_09290, partial [Chlorobiaceae bacterium]|nr:hypothetical protein [Chlorobiaceae bacterium]
MVPATITPAPEPQLIPTPVLPVVTGTGLSQLVDAVRTDPGLAGSISPVDIESGARAAARMNEILLEAIAYTNSGADAVFTVDEIIAINTYIRDTYLDEWTMLHGDDENCLETGYHLVQNDGATAQYRGDNLVNTVADGIYHLGFEIDGDYILNEDGDPNASLQQLSEWMTQFYTDHSTTGTGFDRITNLIMADEGLDKKITDTEIATAADMANRMNEIIVEAITETGVAVDGTITADDIKKINTYIRENHLEEWTALHGDDETGGETGFHLVQNDGSWTVMFGKNMVDTVADGIYHLGFQTKVYNGTEYILNEDGTKNASLTRLASWVQYFYVDQSTTGTGLDRLTDAVKSDPGLSTWTSAADINTGADAANEMNKILAEAITNTGVAVDGVIDPEDIITINEYIRDPNHTYTYQGATVSLLEAWTALHGDDEDGEETGYHLVQNDGSSIDFRGENLINTVADGIYHLGFEIVYNDEDGNYYVLN